MKLMFFLLLILLALDCSFANCMAGLTDSKILHGHSDYSNQLTQYLQPVEIKGKVWKMCFRASDNNFLSASFHAHCNCRGPTVTLVEVGQHVFGGYTAQDWVSHEGYTYDQHAFLFSLKNSLNRPFKALAYRNYAKAIYSNNGYGPTFGNGHDLQLANQCNVNTASYTNFGHTYRAPFGYAYASSQANAILAGSFKFKCDEYEVFYQG